MRIAALQYANGQVKECDGSIEASHSFCRKFRAVIMCTKFTINMDALWKCNLAYINYCQLRTDNRWRNERPYHL